MGCLVLILFVAGLCNLGDTVVFDMKNTRVPLYRKGKTFLLIGYHQGTKEEKLLLQFSYSRVKIKKLRFSGITQSLLAARLIHRNCFVMLATSCEEGLDNMTRDFE